MPLKENANVCKSMDYCRKCKKEVGCNCELIKGYCYTCHAFLLGTIGEQGIQQELEHECRKLPELQRLLGILKAKEIRGDLIGYQIAILNSQIKSYYKNPCEYEEIINQINEN